MVDELVRVSAYSHTLIVYLCRDGIYFSACHAVGASCSGFAVGDAMVVGIWTNFPPYFDVPVFLIAHLFRGMLSLSAAYGVQWGWHASTRDSVLSGLQSYLACCQNERRQ